MVTVREGPRTEGGAWPTAAGWEGAPRSRTSQLGGGRPQMGALGRSGCQGGGRAVTSSGPEGPPRRVCGVMRQFRASHMQVREQGGVYGWGMGPGPSPAPALPLVMLGPHPTPSALAMATLPAPHLCRTGLSWVSHLPRAGFCLVWIRCCLFSCHPWGTRTELPKAALVTSGLVQPDPLVVFLVRG